MTAAVEGDKPMITSSDPTWSRTSRAWVVQTFAELANGHYYYSNVLIGGKRKPSWDMVEDFRQRGKAALMAIIAEGEGV